MRLLRATLLLLILQMASGCGHVAGNYPEPESPSPPELPENFRLGRIKGELVWVEAGLVHGFLILWERADVSAKRLDVYVQQGHTRAAADAKRFQAMVDVGQACASVWVFVAPGFHRSLWPEQIRLDFEDGSSTSAEELFLYNPPSSNLPVQSSVEGSITLDAAADPEKSGRFLYILVPSEHLEKTIASIRCTEN